MTQARRARERRRLLLGVAALPFVPACATRGVPSPHAVPASGDEVAALRSVDEQMRETLRGLDIPGGSLSVARQGRIVYQRGFGWADRAAGQPVRPETRFRIASVSKPMTAVGVLRAFGPELPAALQRPVFGERGLLTGARYARIRDRRVLDITLRDLLQHTAGWDSSVYEPQYDLVQIARAMGVPAPAGATDIIEYMLRERTLDVAPGTRYIYSNFGYNVLGRVLEHKTGLSYAEAMQRLVFAPAQVRSAAIGGDTLAARLPDEAVYDDDPRWADVPSQTGVGRGRPAYNDFHLQAMDAHGGWVMTSADMVRFADAVAGRPGVAGLLPPATVRLMTTHDTRIPGMRNGLGWVVASDGWRHNGALTSGTHSQLERLDNGITWAVVYNRLPSDPVQGIAGLQATFERSVGELRKTLLSALAGVA